MESSSIHDRTRAALVMMLLVGMCLVPVGLKCARSLRVQETAATKPALPSPSVPTPFQSQRSVEASFPESASIQSRSTAPAILRVEPEFVPVATGGTGISRNAELETPKGTTAPAPKTNSRRVTTSGMTYARKPGTQVATLQLPPKSQYVAKDHSVLSIRPLRGKIAALSSQVSTTAKDQRPTHPSLDRPQKGSIRPNDALVAAQPTSGNPTRRPHTITSTEGEGHEGAFDESVNLVEAQPVGGGVTYTDAAEGPGEQMLDPPGGDYKGSMGGDSAYALHVQSSMSSLENTDTATVSDVEQLPPPQDPGAIEGTVHEHGNPNKSLENVTVRVYDAAQGSLVKSVTTEADGSYSAGDLLPGSYKVWFDGQNTPYATEYYSDRTSLATADPVEVAEGATVTGIDLTPDFGPPLEPVDPAPVIAGLRYEYFEDGGGWSSMPVLDVADAKLSGVCTGLDLSLRQWDNLFAFRFTGYLQVPADGLYTFYLSSDDGGKLWIGTGQNEVLVVDNDLPHNGSPNERSGTIGLKAGKHPIRVQYFDNYGGHSLNLYWESSALSRQEVPTNAYSCTPLLDPVDPNPVFAGLKYEYYEDDGGWASMPVLDVADAKETGVCTGLDLGVRQREHLFLIRYTGYLEVPADGDYRFYLSSDDGSKMWIGEGQGELLVVDNDLPHAGSPSERSGLVGLKAGKYPIRVQYFENTGARSLNLYWESSELSRVEVPTAAYFYSVALMEPVFPDPAYAGLSYEYYEDDGGWAAMPVLDVADASQTGVCTGLDLGVRQRDDLFAFKFMGYLQVPEDGQYTFYLCSDDGGRLWIGQGRDEVLVVDNDLPHTSSPNERSGTIGLKAGKHPIRVQFFDNFGGHSLDLYWESSALPREEVPTDAYSQSTMLAPVGPVQVFAGLKFEYYEDDSGWAGMPQLDVVDAKQTGVSTGLDLGVRQRDSLFALKFTGYLNVPADGDYRFYLSSDDGSSLWIGQNEVLVVDNDLPHSAAPNERSGLIGLKAGYYPIRVQYFDNTGAESLNLYWESSALPRQEVPTSAYSCTLATLEPVVPGPVSAGLKYEYYEENGGWASMPELHVADAKQTGVSTGLDLGVRLRDDLFAFRFAGYLEVPADGQYTFYLLSDDGAKFWIGHGQTEVLVVDNDLPHTTSPNERSGRVRLKAGKYPIRVQFFDNYGGHSLNLYWESSVLPREEVPIAAYSYE